MGVKAVDAVDQIVLKGAAKETITTGPYLFMDAMLVDGNNVRRFL
jgi:simple sugar transport system substrate-binding protein/ribose transport system substrate-binding protein